MQRVAMRSPFWREGDEDRQDFWDHLPRSYAHIPAHELRVRLVCGMAWICLPVTRASLDLQNLGRHSVEYREPSHQPILDAWSVMVHISIS